MLAILEAEHACVPACSLDDARLQNGDFTGCRSEVCSNSRDTTIAGCTVHSAHDGLHRRLKWSASRLWKSRVVTHRQAGTQVYSAVAADTKVRNSEGPKAYAHAAHVGR
jgi:hypothetical protein